MRYYLTHQRHWFQYHHQNVITASTNANETHSGQTINHQSLEDYQSLQLQLFYSSSSWSQSQQSFFQDDPNNIITSNPSCRDHTSFHIKYLCNALVNEATQSQASRRWLSRACHSQALEHLPFYYSIKSISGGDYVLGILISKIRNYLPFFFFSSINIWGRLRSWIFISKLRNYLPFFFFFITQKSNLHGCYKFKSYLDRRQCPVSVSRQWCLPEVVIPFWVA